MHLTIAVMTGLTWLNTLRCGCFYDLHALYSMHLTRSAREDCSLTLARCACAHGTKVGLCGLWVAGLYEGREAVALLMQIVCAAPRLHSLYTQQHKRGSTGPQAAASETAESVSRRVAY